jgi:NAD(P)-dependent dehydrogenase (short-subunit alcohol dehydrogenase family)
MTAPQSVAGLAMLATGGSGLGRTVAAAALAGGAHVAALDLDPSGTAPGAVQVKADVSDDTSVMQAAYSAWKGAVLSLTLAMAADHLHEGIRVNCVNPGTADTPWVGRLLARAEDSEAERRALEARQPMGRLVTPEEVAAAVVYLASPSADSVTGTSRAVDGGIAGLRLPPRMATGK